MKKKNNLKEFKNVYKLVKEDRYKLLFAFILIFISSMLSITNGWLQGNIAESIIELNIKGALLFLSAYFIIGVFFNNILEGFGVKIASKIEANLSNKLSVLVYKKTLNLPAYAFEEKSSGELINRITSDTETLSDTFNGIIKALINLLGCMIILVYVFFNSYIVGIEIVVFLSIILIITKVFNPKIKKNNEELKKEKNKYTALSTE